MSSNGCPNPSQYSPCECNPTSGYYKTIELDCSGKNLNDSKTSDILQSFVKNANNLLPMSRLYLRENQLTRVPDEVKYFQQLEYIFMETNQIRTIQSGAFHSGWNRTEEPLSIYLDSNAINRVEPSAFQG